MRSAYSLGAAGGLCCARFLPSPGMLNPSEAFEGLRLECVVQQNLAAQPGEVSLLPGGCDGAVLHQTPTKVGLIYAFLSGSLNPDQPYKQVCL